MQKIKYLVGAAAASFALLFSVAVPKMVGAGVIDPPKKVNICHRTNSATNPYVVLEVDESAVDGVAGNSGNEADHYGEHKGPLASSEQVASQLKKDKIEWGDIIPPVGNHQGLNYDGLGAEMLKNGCNYTTQEPVAICNSLTATKLSRTEFQFTVDATAKNGYAIGGYSYNFGDGSSVSGNSNPVNHTYAKAGTYNVEVEVEFNVTVDSELQPTTDTCVTSVTVDQEGQVLAAQVTATPTGGVSAGAGGASDNAVAVVGLVSSMLAVGLGLVVRRLNN